MPGPPSVATVPNKRWGTDLRHVWSSRDDWNVLALVIDCCRELFGWRLSSAATSNLPPVDQVKIPHLTAAGAVGVYAGVSALGKKSGGFS